MLVRVGPSVGLDEITDSKRNSVSKRAKFFRFRVQKQYGKHNGACTERWISVLGDEWTKFQHQTWGKEKRQLQAVRIAEGNVLLAIVTTVVDFLRTKLVEQPTYQCSQFTEYVGCLPLNYKVNIAFWVSFIVSCQLARSQSWTIIFQPTGQY